MNAITDVMNVYITLANPLKKMIVSESVAEVVVVEDDEEKESVVATESESESEEDEEDKAERLALEATRNLNAIREAKRVAKEKKSMKAKITEYRGDFIGNINLAKAENTSEIARILAEIENLRTEIGGFKEKINATNRGEYDEEILAKKMLENVPKKVVKKAPKKIVKKTGCGAGVKRGKSKRYGKHDWGNMLQKDTLLRYGFHVKRDGGNCLYGKACVGVGGKAEITPTDKNGNTYNWATKTTNFEGSWDTLSGFVHSVKLEFDKATCKKGSWDWVDARGTTPFGEYYDESVKMWKPLAKIEEGHKIN